jgi:hypothetical protein
MCNKKDKKEMYKTDNLRRGLFTTNIAHTVFHSPNSHLMPIKKQNQWSFMGK